MSNVYHSDSRLGNRRLKLDCRITDLRPLLLAVPLERPTDLPTGQWRQRLNLIVIIETSVGIRGIGEVWVNFPAWGCSDRIAVLREVIRPLLIGEIVDQPERLYRLLVRRLKPLASRWGAWGPVSHAIAGTDIALWDIAARAAGQPLRDFIAGSKRPSLVDVYSSGIGPAAPAPLIERAARDGHIRFKLRLVSGSEKDCRILREGREAAGDRPLMADPAETYDHVSIQAIWEDVVAARLDWLEEPFPVYDDRSYRAYRDLPQAPPLALGESNYGLDAFKRLIDEFAPKVVQPDITKTGGMTEGAEIARMIVERSCRFCPHMLAGPVGLVASANLFAAIDGAHLLEMDADPVPTYEPILGRQPFVENGRLALSDEPGLGISLDESTVSRWIVDTS
jgi:D-galactarolactone cycloisomerase